MRRLLIFLVCTMTLLGRSASAEIGGAKSFTVAQNEGCANPLALTSESELDACLRGFGSGNTSRPSPRAPALTSPAQTADIPLSPQIEMALKPKNTFRECSHCPTMIVIPRGRFTMGSPKNERGRDYNESPQHTVRLCASVRGWAIRSDIQ